MIGDHSPQPHHPEQKLIFGSELDSKKQKQNVIIILATLLVKDQIQGLVIHLKD